MPLDRLTDVLDGRVARLEEQGTAKGSEPVVCEVIRPEGGRGPRFRLEGGEGRLFIRMNSNSYLGLGLHPEVIRAGEAASQAAGAGPGAVRFIIGAHTYHVELERALADFHGREEGMLFSSAYNAVLGVLTSLVDEDTAVISDELNHNSIINALRLAGPRSKAVYPHLDAAELDRCLEEAQGRARRAVIVTDGVFSMRGDHAPLDEIMRTARRRDPAFPENAVVVVDDSHGVGAFGASGRGTEEYTGSPPADLLIGTLGKALGVNGGYAVSSRPVIRYLREAAPLYIYSNPITPGEAAAALAALRILRSAEGEELLAGLRRLTDRLESGLTALGCEVVPGGHPIVPLMLRDGAETRRLEAALYEAGVLATGLAYPVVPKGGEEIRFQVNADHTPADIDRVLEALAAAL